MDLADGYRGLGGCGDGCYRGCGDGYRGLRGCVGGGCGGGGCGGGGCVGGGGGCGGGVWAATESHHR